MGGPEAALLSATLGSALLGGIFAPEGQELSSFEGDADVDPRNTAAQLRQGLSQYLQMALNEAASPVSVRTTVAPLPQYSGGGLPFDIGAPAIDPNRADVSLRSIPGLDIGEGFESLVNPPRREAQPRDWLTGREAQLRDQPPPEDPEAQRQGPERRSFIPEPIQLERYGDNVPILGEAGEDVATTQPVPVEDDLDQAEGAIELLLAQLRQDGRGLS